MSDKVSCFGSSQASGKACRRGTCIGRGVRGMVWWVAVGGIAAASAGCGSDEKLNVPESPGEAEDMSEAHPEDLPTLKLFITEGDAVRRMVEVPPPGYAHAIGGAEPSSAPTTDDVFSATRERNETSVGDRAAREREQPRSIVGQTGEGEVDPFEEDEAGGHISGATLYEWLANSCWVNYSAAPTANLGMDWGPFRLPLRTTGYRQSAGLQPGCDNILQTQKKILCMAGRLNEIADGVGTQVFSSEVPPWDEVSESITIEAPPQSAADRFIARDMALHLLARFAEMEARASELMADPANSAWAQWPSVSLGSDSARSCVEIYDQSLRGTTEGDLVFPWALAIDNQDGEPLATDGSGSAGPWWGERFTSPSDPGFQALVKDRLQEKAVLFATAVRMEKGLLDANFANNVAQGARLRGRAGSTELGNTLSWGLGPNGSPYNSYGHALATLFGRLELSQLVSPSSYTVENPLGLFFPAARDPLEITKELPESFFATLADTPARTKHEARAVALVDSMGLVIDPSVVSSSPEAAARAVRDQLTVGLSGDSGLHEALLHAVDALEPTDIAFGLLRTWNAFQTLLDASDTELEGGDLAALATAAGLKVQADGVADSVTSLDGLVITGGIPRSDVAGNALARLGAVTTFSQFGGPAYPSDPYYDWNWQTVGHHRELRATPYNDVFLLGQTLKRWMVKMRETSDTIGEDDTQRVAGSGIQEAEWAGDLMIAGNRTYCGGGECNDYQIEVHGLDLASWGANTIHEAADQLRLVFGRRWAVECISGERASCPEDLDDFVCTPVHSSASPADLGVPLGYRTNSFYMRFDCPEGVSIGTYPVVWLVRKPEVGRGTLLAGLDGGAGGYISARVLAAVSPYREQMIKRILGGEEVQRTDGRCAAVPSLARHQDYCIEGTETHQFVPLANELTSESGVYEDSWRHYLERAKEAANKADQLAQQIIDIGMAEDAREEAALEEVTDICGSVPMVDEMSVSEEGVTLGASDSAMVQCVEEEVADLVVLSGEAPNGVCDSLCDDPDLANDVPFCSKCDGTDPLVTRSLGLPAFSGSGDVAYSSLNQCRGWFERAWNPGAGWDSAVLIEMSDQPWASREALIANASQLRLMEYLGSWALRSGSHSREEVVFSSAPVGQDPEEIELAGSQWPRCLTLDDGCSDSVAWLEDLFGPDLTQFVGAPDPDGPADYDYLRQYRVEDAMKSLGALAGYLPPGAFVKMLPVALVTNTQLTTASPHYLSYYGAFGDIGPYWDWEYSGYMFNNVGAEVSTMGPIYELDSASIPLLANPRAKYGSTEQRNAYDSFSTAAWPVGVRYAGNREVVFDAGASLPDPCDTSSVSTNGERYYTRHEMGSWLKRMSSCSHAAGVMEDLSDAVAGYLALEGYGPRFVSGCVSDTDGRIPAGCLEPSLVSYRPTAWPPEDRIAAFGALPRHAGRSWQSALLLSCVMSNQDVNVRQEIAPPPVRTPADLHKLEAWVALSATMAQSAANEIMFSEIPLRSLDSYMTGDAGVRHIDEGSVGQARIDLLESLERVYLGWRNVNSGFKAVSAALHNARLGIEGAGIRRDQELTQLVRERLDLERNQALEEVAQTATIIHDVVNVGAAATSTTIPMNRLSEMASAMGHLAADMWSQAEMRKINRDYYSETVAALGEQQGLAGAEHDNNVAQTLAVMGTEVQAGHEMVAEGLSEVRLASASVNRTVAEIRRQRARAEIALAKAAGARVATTVAKDMPIVLNTVYQRQFGVLSARYANALAEAKRAAYLARLSIEQKLGVRFEEMTEDVGPIDAPALWVEDLCSLEGVDYESLASSVGDETAEEEELLIRGFAEQYIGDYVDKLEEVVEFYNLERPFREGDDRVVVSLSDLVGIAGSCDVVSRNMLLHSDALTHQPLEVSEEGRAVEGWRVVSNANYCVSAYPEPGTVAGAESSPVQPVPPPGGVGAASLLAVGECEGGVLPEPPSPLETLSEGGVYQTVDITAAGEYVLSWFDSGRASDGSLVQVGDPAPTYLVSVIDAEGIPVWLSEFAAHVALEEDDAWSERRQDVIPIGFPGSYHVAFSVRAEPDQVPTVALANVQLERIAGGSGFASAYVRTTGTRVQTVACPAGSAENLRDAFVHKCNAEDCWYELVVPISLDRGALAKTSPESGGGLAQGNFNLRHDSIALNLVGTGVIDCSLETPSCYGNGLVEYDLVHEASSVAISDYTGRDTCFDFGSGWIRGGKALATERYITQPISDADQSLIGQSGIMKREFAGRPVDGLYRLTVHDRPGLQWSKVEDIQLVLGYSYWAPVEMAD